MMNYLQNIYFSYNNTNNHQFIEKPYTLKGQELIDVNGKIDKGL